jgi:hypothetical protein
MRFVSPEGRVEILWVDPVSDVPSTYRNLNVPVWVYDISVGTVVEGRSGETGYIEFVRVVKEALGGTVRVITASDDRMASHLYLDRILADCQERRIMIGPATFFDPAMVAIHVQDWEQYHEPLLAYLDELRAAGEIQEYEVGDPAEPSDEPQEPARTGSDLIHPPPSPRRPYVRDSDAAT